MLTANLVGIQAILLSRILVSLSDMDTDDDYIMME